MPLQYPLFHHIFANSGLTAPIVSHVLPQTHTQAAIVQRKRIAKGATLYSCMAYQFAFCVITPKGTALERKTTQNAKLHIQN
jgi:hypothetical protein